jgi:hypothetical protein
LSIRLLIRLPRIVDAPKEVEAAKPTQTAEAATIHQGQGRRSRAGTAPGRVPDRGRLSPARKGQIFRHNEQLYTPRFAMNGVANIACCFDSNVELPFLVLANSIQRHLKGRRKVVLHAFHSNPLTHRVEFGTKLRSNAFFEIRFHPVENPYSETDYPHYFTAAAYMRLMLPALLKDVDRVLYTLIAM